MYNMKKCTDTQYVCRVQINPTDNLCNFEKPKESQEIDQCEHIDPNLESDSTLQFWFKDVTWTYKYFCLTKVFAIQLSTAKYFY